MSKGTNKGPNNNNMGMNRQVISAMSQNEEDQDQTNQNERMYEYAQPEHQDQISTR